MRYKIEELEKMHYQINNILQVFVFTTTCILFREAYEILYTSDLFTNVSFHKYSIDFDNTYNLIVTVAEQQYANLVNIVTFATDYIKDLV